jgi:hypothetical protein
MACSGIAFGILVIRGGLRFSEIPGAQLQDSALRQLCCQFDRHFQSVLPLDGKFV